MTRIFTTTFWLAVVLVGTSVGQDLRLTVDQATGAVRVENVDADSTSFKGYTIGSVGQHLSSEGWTSLADSGLEGWTEANPTGGFLSELNFQAESVLNAGESFELGTAYVTGPHAGDLFFEYLTTDLDVVVSNVHYTGPTNDLAVYVDPNTGEASMANLSPFIDVPSVQGYSILSLSGGLQVDSWTSFADSGGAGDGWIEANPSGNHLSELNLDLAATFENPTAIPLGVIIAPASDTRDLVFEYVTAEGEIRNGSVQYTALPGGGDELGDCNGDGVVDKNDLACISTVEERDVVLASIPSLPGDLDGNGAVDFADFITLSTNFGQNLPGYQDGNVDLADGVDFGDFIGLSLNFGKVPAVAVAVPEPSMLPLSLLVLVWVGRAVKRRSPLP